MDFKNLLKNIGKASIVAAENAASLAVPGASIVIAGVTKLLDKDHTNTQEAIDQLEAGVVSVVSSVSSDKVADAVLLLDGVNDIQKGFAKVKAALKK